MKARVRLTGSVLVAPEWLQEMETYLRRIVREELAALGAATRQDDHEILTTTEAAAVARVSQATIRRWLREGRLKERGAGREHRISRAELANMPRARGKSTDNGAISPEARATRLIMGGR